MPDDLHFQVRSEIFRLYRQLVGLDCPWGASSGKNLKRIIQACTGWKAEDFIFCIHARFASDLANWSEDPKWWISELPNYAAGPLDRYKRAVTRTGNEYCWELLRQFQEGYRRSLKSPARPDRRSVCTHSSYGLFAKGEKAD